MRSLAPEIKALDVPAAVYNCNGTAVITPLNLIQTGSTFCNRIGRKVEMKNIRVSGRLNQIRSVNISDYVRIMIIYDRQTNGAVPSISDILQSTDQTTTNSTSILSGLNLNNRDRFVVIRDLRIAAPPFNDANETVGATDPLTVATNIDLFAKIPGYVTQYKADSSPAVIGDIASGGLYLVTFGGIAAGSEGYNAYLECRLRYLDM